MNVTKCLMKQTCVPKYKRSSWLDLVKDRLWCSQPQFQTNAKTSAECTWKTHLSCTLTASPNWHFMVLNSITWNLKIIRKSKSWLNYSITWISTRSLSLLKLNNMLKNWMKLSERKASHQLHAIEDSCKIKESRSMRISRNASIESWSPLIFSEEVSMLRRSTSSSTSTCQMRQINISIVLVEQEDLEPRVWQFHSFQVKKTKLYSMRFKADLKWKLKSCQQPLTSNTTWTTEQMPTCMIGKSHNSEISKEYLIPN